MKNNYDSLQSFVFIPLSEVKAKLSEQIQRSASKRIAITNHGKPVAVLLSYHDYQKLLGQLDSHKYPQAASTGRVIDYEEWKLGSARRKKASQAILDLFDMESLRLNAPKGVPRYIGTAVDRKKSKIKKKK